MRAQIKRAVEALCMGRSRKVVAAELAVSFALAGVAWFAACLFMALEPLP